MFCKSYCSLILLGIFIQVTCYEPEVVGMQLCSKTQLHSHVQPPSIKSGGGIEPMMDLAQVAEASSKLSLMLEQVLSYVDDVLAGKQLPDNQVDMDTIAARSDIHGSVRTENLYSLCHVYYRFSVPTINFGTQHVCDVCLGNLLTRYIDTLYAQWFCYFRWVEHSWTWYIPCRRCRAISSTKCLTVM